LRNKLEFEDNELEPIHCMKKCMGYLLLTCYVLATSLYICLFGISNGTQMTKTWLLSFLVADLQDIFLFAPLKIYIMFVYLPSLISKNVSRSQEGLFKVKHWYGKIVNENAAVYVALNHPELEASPLVLDAFSYAGEEVAVEGKTGPGGGRLGAKRRSIWNPGSKLEEGGDEMGGRQRSKSAAQDVGEETLDNSTFQYKGLRRIGIFIFGWYGMLPDMLQVRRWEERGHHSISFNHIHTITSLTTVTILKI
jgi:hypothetical protein